jgi:valyl-tRNA synthetase
MKELSKFFDYKTKEKQIAENWKKEGFYKFLNTGNSFMIDTPPPTVSGFLHMGHVFSYVQADLIARYKRQKGFDVFYPIGFDDNGLPTERLVEKLTGKKVGRNCTKEEFVNECYKVVEDAEKDFEDLFTQIGLSVDFKLKYQTISSKTAEISQNSFIDLWEKGLIYQKLAPVYFDVIDKTALAQADIEEKEMEGLQVTYKALIELEGETFEKVEIMTTRPELLPACVCVFFHPDDERYKKFAGKKVLLPNKGAEYELEVPLIPDEDVAKEKGTGLVMCCAFGDIQDKIWIERHKLWDKIKTRYVLANGMPTLEKTEFATQNLITDDGFVNDSLFVKEEGSFMKVEEARKFIIEKFLSAFLVSGMKVPLNLEEAITDVDVKVSKISRPVKCGERSGKPVEILFKNQWYLSLLPFKRDFKEVIKKLNFHPSNMKIRLEQWVEGLNQDWCISRDRFFGISLPVREFAFQENVSRETLQNIKNEFYKDDFSLLVKKFGGNAKEEYFEMEDEMLEKMMESEDYLHFEDSFVLSGMDLEIKNIGIKKYAIEIHRNLEGVFKELLSEFSSEIFEEKKFILKDRDLAKLISLIKEKKEILEEVGIENLQVKTEDIVFDTWFTSSISPQVAFGDLMKCPVFDLRPQAHEIIRTWAFYTMAKTYLHSLELKSVDKKPNAKLDFNSREFFRMKENPNIIPWKNVMLSGWCLASDKTKMSKSKGNVITPLKLIEEKGVDVIRLWCSSSSLGTDTAYSETLLDDGRRFINKLWNAFKFFSLKESQFEKDAEITESFDKWIIARLNQVFTEYQNQMDAFEYSKAKEILDNFFWKDLCDNYLEAIKVRYYGLEALIYKENPPSNSAQVKQKQLSALKALRVTLEGILILYAPFVPFIAEELSKVFFGYSVHTKGSLANFTFPKFDVSQNTIEALKLIEAVRKFKSENSLAMNAVVESFNFKTEIDITSFEEDLKNVTGVKNFIYE